MRWALPIIALLAFAVVTLLLREWGCGCKRQVEEGPAPVPMRASAEQPRFRM